MRYRKTKNKIKFTWFFVADERNVVHRVSSTEEGTRLGDSLISNTERIADGNQLTHRVVSAAGSGDKPVAVEESMKEVANVINNVQIYYFSDVRSVLIMYPKGNLKEIMALIFWLLSWIPYLTKPKTAS